MKLFTFILIMSLIGGITIAAMGSGKAWNIPINPACNGGRLSVETSWIKATDNVIYDASVVSGSCSLSIGPNIIENVATNDPTEIELLVETDLDTYVQTNTWLVLEPEPAQLKGRGVLSR